MDATALGLLPSPGATPSSGQYQMNLHYNMLKSTVSWYLQVNF